MPHVAQQLGPLVSLDVVAPVNAIPLLLLRWAGLLDLRDVDTMAFARFASAIVLNWL